MNKTSSSAREYLFVLGSTRPQSNSEALARHAARFLPQDTRQRWLRLLDHPLPPFFDTRHAGGYNPPTGDAKILCEATLSATDLVLVTPVNWYSVSWPMKLYLDHFSAWMRIEPLAFLSTMKGKRLYGVVSDSDTDGEGAADPVTDTLRRTANYLEMEFGGVLLGHGNRPGEILQDEAAMRHAEHFLTR